MTWITRPGGAGLSIYNCANEILCMQHTRFYQSGRQRRKRSSGIVQPTAGDSTTTHPSKSKPRRSSTSVSTAKFAPVSQRRQFEGQRVSCEPGVRPGHQAPKQGSGTELSPVKTSIQIKCTSHATPSVMENSDKVNFQGDRASSQSTAGTSCTQVMFDSLARYQHVNESLICRNPIDSGVLNLHAQFPRHRSFWMSSSEAECIVRQCRMYQCSKQRLHLGRSRPVRQHATVEEPAAFGIYPVHAILYRP